MVVTTAQPRSPSVQYPSRKPTACSALLSSAACAPAPPKKKCASTLTADVDAWHSQITPPSTIQMRLGDTRSWAYQLPAGPPMAAAARTDRCLFRKPQHLRR